MARKTTKSKTRKSAVKPVLVNTLRVELRQVGDGWLMEWWKLTKRELVKNLPNAAWESCKRRLKKK